MDAKMEITRTVSLLRSLLRDEVGKCGRLIEAGEIERARDEISEIHDKLIRAINVLNRLR
jgi:hypothetical protein